WQKFSLLRRADNQPEHLGVSIIENLAQLVWPDEHAAVLRHGQSFVAHADASLAFDDKIEFLGPNVFVERVGALRRKPPKPRPKKLALCPLQEIRVGNLHQVGGPPMEILGLDQKVTVNRLHVVGEYDLAARAVQRARKPLASM